MLVTSDRAGKQSLGDRLPGTIAPQNVGGSMPWFSNSFPIKACVLTSGVVCLCAQRLTVLGSQNRASDRPRTPTSWLARESQGSGSVEGRGIMRLPRRFSGRWLP